MTARLIAYTQGAEKLMTDAATQFADPDAIIGYCARVSNPANQENPDVAGLLRYCARNGHWSVFEMANAVVEIESTRDIARQMLRHRSFSFQEFSQRYGEVSDMQIDTPMREARLQDTKNRQNSLQCNDVQLARQWEDAQAEVNRRARMVYEWALHHGIAKEQARAVLPEGLTPSRMYVNGTLRSWITYLQVRLDPSTQKEHREVAAQVLEVLHPVAPITFGALFP
jgi:thymidylate synthase (FAD)